ncbi:glycoside hydrolase family 5 protein [Mucilaginibacter koreensis]
MMKYTGFKLAINLVLIFIFHIANSTPIIPGLRQLAFKRAQSLNHGISVSALEQTWNAQALNAVVLTAADYALLKQLGFKNIRLPVAFRYFEEQQIPIDTVADRIEKVWQQCRKYGFKLVIDYHYGKLDDNNYLSETPKIIAVWQYLAQKYQGKYEDDLFFELYNEPPHMNEQVWKDAAYNISNAIRAIDKQRTLLIGASNFNSIYELSRFVRLADENIIYTFHFYEPFFFTHQGAAWVGNQVATIGVPFPYNEEKFPALNPAAKNTWGETNYYQYRRDGNAQSVKDKLQIVKAWGNKYAVPLLCTEYGVYNQYADLDSRCRYIKAVRQSLKQLNIPGMLWDYNTNFSLFNGKPSVADLSPCMREALQ